MSVKYEFGCWRERGNFPLVSGDKWSCVVINWHCGCLTIEKRFDNSFCLFKILISVVNHACTHWGPLSSLDMKIDVGVSGGFLFLNDWVSRNDISNEAIIDKTKSHSFLSRSNATCRWPSIRTSWTRFMERVWSPSSIKLKNTHTGQGSLSDRTWPSHFVMTAIHTWFETHRTSQAKSFKIYLWM